MRYIGSKKKLLNDIKKLLDSKIKIKQGMSFCDIFAGTGVVGEYFKDIFRIISNDNLYFPYILSCGKLEKNNKSFSKLGINPFDFFNQCDVSSYKKGYCYNTFSPYAHRQYFSDENAKLIDFIRDTIEKWYKQSKINVAEYNYLLASLIESISKVANVAGVYSAYLHIWDPRAIKRLLFCPVEVTKDVKYNNIVYNENANDLIKKISGDILYLDPPYTSTQYISQYHVLETIAKNDKPKTHGIGAHRDNGFQISKWSKKVLVEVEFEEIIRQAKFKYIIFSYSDAGLMSKEFIEKVLRRYAKNNSYTFKKIDFDKYKNTRAINRQKKLNSKVKKHFEWLFFIEKKEEPKFISPLNYIGGKFDTIDLIKKNLPKAKINNFYDLFGGGATVSLNISANRIIYNDINWNVVRLLKDLSFNNVCSIIRELFHTIKKYNLEKANKISYINFRNIYNSMEPNKRKSLYLYLLICYGFEHQIRYNSHMKFNNPCGNSSFNDEMLEKLISYNQRVNSINIKFNSEDYKLYENDITSKDFVYCDPPYLMTCGAYNDGKRGFKGWDGIQQSELFNFLNRLNKRKIKFMLSYMLERNGETNKELRDWAKKNKYKIILDSTITKRNRQDRREIIVINY